MSESSLGHVPGERWEFDAAVTDVFDDMLHRSIPHYQAMRDACFEVARPFAQFKSDIVDVGCSRGEALEPFIRHLGARNRFVGLECSVPMLESARRRFAGYIETGLVEIRQHDLRDEYPAFLASVTLAVLTLQFVPIEHRQRLVRAIYRSTRPGGALVLVEKVLGATAEIDGTLVDAYYRVKQAHGYTRDEIDRKRLALEGVLVPVTARWNEDLLHAAGFAHVDCFWRSYNFAAWLAIREPK